MNTPLPDLSDLLHGAVDDLEPADRLDAIREQAAADRTGHRRWWYAGGAVALAAAATVAAFAVVLSQPADHHEEPPVTATDTPTGAPTETQVVPVYFVGSTPRGDRLFREYDVVPAGDPIQAALDRIQRPASDPDYSTGWQHGSFDTATVTNGVIEVRLGADTTTLSAGAVEGISEQQLVYTLQGAIGERLPVQIVRDGEPVGDPLQARPQTQVLSQVMINDPTEGLAVGAGFTAHGAANSFEANVPWEIRDEHGKVVKKGYATAAGWGDRLYPWSATIDVRDLPAGFYTFAAMTDDPSGGEGGGPDADTRTIIVR